ncbi:phosphatase PAP2 family protein [Lysobacter sp. A6]|uniref:undecaprenyl-diphosphate phosphatase n=1 Tax=Noviluteimonas lactosilytica TaxID=2888523 RepID=A0ABS8JER9_9GAMM|nr:phosphatase PAP2 family protein [Lysobacter lactosilyticus]MCC8362096.1 phosphatase PAP2 family protein [Lysobacter lactosilyticus]
MRNLPDIDSSWCLKANHWCERRKVRSVFAVVSRLGDGAAWYALMAVVIAVDGRAGLFAAAHLAVTGAIALGLYAWLKRWTKRPRPFASDARIHAWVAPLDEFSFPSGHTLHAVAFTLVALAHYPVLAWVLVPFASTVAVSRVVLGLHYPSDVLAATAIGTCIASLSLWCVPGATLF